MNETGMWIALKDCGCCVAVCRETIGPSSEQLAHNNAEIVLWLRQGYTVRFVSWAQWQARYMTGFLECEHKQVQTL